MSKADPADPAAPGHAGKTWGRSREDVQNITTAHTSHSDDIHRRLVKYSIAMGIRMVCLFAMFFVDGLWKLVPIAGAVFLPWFAVIIANGGGDTVRPDQNALLTQAPQDEIADSRDSVDPASEHVDQEPTAAQTLLQGEVVPDEPEETGEQRPAGSPT
ncbi:DUF3099 domain-containing protein [Acaricomes phytoseiuli]|uniref:DUF3099 domain-containing protein n=1 Tax=Acaricomes phytoseiuli TaxID=291968 RepID=UPI00035C7217|nr:DUF3099 domain-containing protein [Acaricomes phytoseiuli]MCW1250263.1 DUF3099 domain-containing protein [Acaricomes phytoseiuli]